MIEVLIGPCTESEADDMHERIADATNGDLGAVASLSIYPNPNTPSADFFADSLPRPR